MSEPQGKIIPTIKTYAFDVKDAVEHKNTSIADIALAEERRKESLGIQEEQEFSSLSRKNIVYIILGVFLILIGGMSVWYFGFFKKPKETIQATENKPLYAIEIEQEYPFSVTGKIRADITKELEKVRLSEIQVGSMVSFLMTEKDVPLTTEQGFSSLGIRAPGKLIRSLNPQFLLAIHSFDEKRSFILLKTNSFQNAFSGMIEWEATMMWDLEGILFSREIPQLAAPPTQQSTSTPTSTPSTTNQSDVGFIDAVIANRDARIYKDQTNKNLFYYTFIDETHILLASDTTTAKEIIERLNNASLIR